MTTITEIVTMKTAEEITKEEFISIVDGLEKEYHSKQPGFIDTELLYDCKSNEWIMIQHWASMEELKASSKKLLQAKESALFVKTLDSKAVKMKILPQSKSWK